MAVTQEEIKAAYKAARSKVDATGYGHWVSDALIMDIVRGALAAADKVDPLEHPAPKP